MCAPLAHCAARPVCLYGALTACALPVFPLAHLMCEKWKEIKAISFSRAGVGCGSPWAGGGVEGGETGSKISQSLQSLGSVRSAAGCQKQQRKLLVKGSNHR